MEASSAGLRRLGFVDGEWFTSRFMTVLESGCWEGGLEPSLLFLSLEMRNYKFLPRTGGPTLGWAPKTQRKGFSGNSRAVLRGAGSAAFVLGGRPQTPCSGGRWGRRSGFERVPLGDRTISSSSWQSLRLFSQSRRPRAHGSGADSPALKSRTGLTLLS